MTTGSSKTSVGLINNNIIGYEKSMCFSCLGFGGIKILCKGEDRRRKSLCGVSKASGSQKHTHTACLCFHMFNVARALEEPTKTH